MKINFVNSKASIAPPPTTTLRAQHALPLASELGIDQPVKALDSARSSTKVFKPLRVVPSDFGSG